MPGAGHLVHMPSHIYLRIGRYADAVDGERRAVKADRAYIAKRQAERDLPRALLPAQPRLPLAGGQHGRTGRGDDAGRARVRRGRAAGRCSARCRTWRPRRRRRIFALARFGRWEEILASRRRPRSSRTSTGAWRYARGLAFAATGRRAEAEAELAALRRIAAGVPAERTLAGFFKTKAMLELAGTCSRARSPRGRARRTRRSGASSPPWREQDGHWFTEPPPWYFPVRQSLGAVLLAGGPARRRPRPCIARTSAESRRTAGRSSGSPGVSRAQGKAAEAAAVDARFRRAWARADVTLWAASRF